MGALGVTVYLRLSGQRPWFHSDMKERARMICEDPVPFPDKEWKRVSDEAKDFVLRLLNNDPENRPARNRPTPYQTIGKEPRTQKTTDREITKKKT